ncbi:hypothetical protein K439DRAFT_554175 [Ramaria rubella]|nr:hypothetical protein K439DRAFT_1625342 [Ramaria rubella]KAF8577448.1 hypothetical protein K439DRAFT_554175 [Ramaria rubella]
MPYTLKFAWLSIKVTKQLVTMAITFLEIFPESLGIKLVKEILTYSTNILTHSRNILAGITTLLELLSIGPTQREPQALPMDLVPQNLPPTLELINMGEFDRVDLIDCTRDILGRGE